MWIPKHDIKTAWRSCVRLYNDGHEPTVPCTDHASHVLQGRDEEMQSGGQGSNVQNAPAQDMRFRRFKSISRLSPASSRKRFGQFTDVRHLRVLVLTTMTWYSCRTSWKLLSKTPAFIHVIRGHISLNFVCALGQAFGPCLELCAAFLASALSSLANPQTQTRSLPVCARADGNASNTGWPLLGPYKSILFGMLAPDPGFAHSAALALFCSSSDGLEYSRCWPDAFAWVASTGLVHEILTQPGLLGQGLEYFPRQVVFAVDVQKLTARRRGQAFIARQPCKQPATCCFRQVI